MRSFFLYAVSSLLMAAGVQTVPMGSVFPSAAAPTNPYVRGNANAGSCSTCTLTFSSNTAGHALVVAVDINSSYTITSVSDSANGSYGSAVLSFNVGNFGNTIAFFVKCNIAASSGANTVTINVSGSSFAQYAIAEYSVSGCVDGVGNGASGCCTALASGAWAVSANDVWIGWGYGGGSGCTAGSGFTLEAASTDAFVWEDGVFSGTSAQATMTCPASQWMMGGIALKR